MLYDPPDCPTGVWGAPFCIGCLWQGIEAMFGGHPYSLPFASVVAFSRLRRFFILIFCVRWFRVISLVSPPALGLLCGGFVYAFGYLCVIQRRASNLTIFQNYAEISQIRRLLFVAFENRSAFTEVKTAPPVIRATLKESLIRMTGG